MDGQFREARTEVMHLFSFDVETVKRMIDYLYTGQFNGDLKSEEVDSATTIEAGDSSFSQDDALLSIRLHMHAIADYLEISGLRERAIESICHVLGINWSIERFLSAMNTILATSQDADMYEAMASIAADHIKELLDSEEFIHLDMPNRMTLGIARELAKGQTRSRRYPCRCCSRCKFRQ
ncbi:predicted protein [Histoplasma capsulatum G186AR]|uniref:BTB domain-containing protein n=1 Tax=Ajellomyces capsulatus (strain G186AR / H82 / ATCC MYA-2454 / RMSCC 2432) TaxID=447093 RepID=C0NUR2_AJECG|nr:uncharacterized protein HCBG_06676 [Histoplasma capsulatum G186AR]EEH04725.1 predicted protein [Histoplasma capsulatum G186AR]